MKFYRKLVAGVVGLALLLANRYVGLDLSGQEQVIVDTVISVGTAVGIWGAKNEPKDA
jgi:hypothetical protein